MQKVVAINLNGRAYHVEEPGYDALVAYLDRAGAQLADNPDRAEILADIEQAIAEKCDRLLGPHRTVVAGADVDRILGEMGPVDTGDGKEQAADAAAGADAGADGTRGGDAKAAASQKRLYQIREGAMISGVCTGLAAYFGVDVTLVRIGFVILAVATRGVWLAVYGVLMFVIPYAETPEERAAASGQPFTAQELIDQAKRNYTEFRDGKEWRRQWRRQQREWHRQWRHVTAPHAWNAQAAYASQVWTRATAPVFGLINAALTLALMFGLYSLTTSHSAFGVPLPDGVPLWVGIVILLGLYQAIAIPFVAAHRAVSHPGPPGLVLWMSPVWNLLWMCAIGYGIWYGYHHVPAVHDAIDRVLTALRHTAAEMQEK
jgi:phage shock protein PspC (stress-responsive transcriptional regulator)